MRAAELTCSTDVSGGVFESADGDAWRRAHEFANAFWVSETSTAVLVLSTGRLPAATPSGQVALEPGAGQSSSVDNDNPDGVALPAPIEPMVGSASPYADCDGTGDCSHTLAPAWDAAHDLVWLRIEADVPPGVRGYTARVAFFTAEYPERIGAAVSDMFVWWTDSAAFTGNLATWQGAAATVTGLADVLSLHTAADPSLPRTGFDGTTGEPCTQRRADVRCVSGGRDNGLDDPARPGGAGRASDDRRCLVRSGRPRAGHDRPARRLALEL